MGTPFLIIGAISIMKRRRFVLVLLCLVCFSSVSLAEEEYKFDISEIEKKPYHVGGYAEFRPVIFWLDEDAALYKLRFFNEDEGNTTEEYNGKLQIEGSYEKGIARLFARVNGNLTYNYQGWSDSVDLYEGTLSLKPSNSLAIDLGKKVQKWGKGYAWNPVAFVDRPKDPEEPDLALEGFWMVSADYIKSFNGPLKTLSITPVILPVYEHINDEFGKINEFNFAGKLYLLLYDTDIDLLFLTGGSRTTRFGLDFSRNITTNFEIHGEFAYINNFKQKTTDEQGRVSESKFDAKSYLLGIRYLTKTDTTFILEYYHNGTGYTKGEIGDFFPFVNKSYETYLSSGNQAPLMKAQDLAEGNYSRVNPMKDYLYLRVSQKDPFNILYWTPALTGILNLNDGSFSFSPELTYTGITNLELRLKGTANVGQKGSEYGEKPSDYRLEFRARYYF
jgi:hypothetical protein